MVRQQQAAVLRLAYGILTIFETAGAVLHARRAIERGAFRNAFWLVQRGTAMPKIKSACSPLSAAAARSISDARRIGCQGIQLPVLCPEIIRKKIRGQLIGIDRSSSGGSLPGRSELVK